MTAPALTLALAAVIISFVAPSHKDATLTCAIIGIIFSIGVIAWCAVDLAACHSFQGPYHTRTWEKVNKAPPFTRNEERWYEEQKQEQKDEFKMHSELLDDDPRYRQYTDTRNMTYP